MGKAKRPLLAKLIIGELAKDKKLLDSVEEFFIGRFGEIDYRSPVLLFDYTGYYKKEMGHPLKRRFVSFKDLISPQDIAEIKLITNKLEEEFAGHKNGTTFRRINIDPGYMTDSKLILATTKDYYHRIYLKQGIYAEVTLVWQRGSFRPFEWTYPDYKTKEYIEILNSIRNTYHKQRT